MKVFDGVKRTDREALDIVAAETERLLSNRMEHLELTDYVRQEARKMAKAVVSKISQGAERIFLNKNGDVFRFYRGILSPIASSDPFPSGFSRFAAPDAERDAGAINFFKNNRAVEISRCGSKNPSALVRFEGGEVLMATASGALTLLCERPTGIPLKTSKLVSLSGFVMKDSGRLGWCDDFGNYCIADETFEEFSYLSRDYKVTKDWGMYCGVSGEKEQIGAKNEQGQPDKIFGHLGGYLVYRQNGVIRYCDNARRPGELLSFPMARMFPRLPAKILDIQLSTVHGKNRNDFFVCLSDDGALYATGEGTKAGLFGKATNRLVCPRGTFSRRARFAAKPFHDQVRNLIAPITDGTGKNRQTKLYNCFSGEVVDQDFNTDYYSGQPTLCENSLASVAANLLQKKMLLDSVKTLDDLMFFASLNLSTSNATSFAPLINEAGGFSQADKLMDGMLPKLLQDYVRKSEKIEYWGGLDDFLMGTPKGW